MTKNVLFIAFIGLLSSSTLAQLPVPRVPVYEVFSSSTCPPCRPANEYLTPLFEEYEGQIAVVKYQMSWPGTGDPYFTAEANNRRSAYAVNSVPALFRNSVDRNPTSLTASNIDTDLEDMVYMDIKLRYLIDTNNQSVRVRARIEALDDFTDGGHRVMIPIIEHLTTKNKKSNGENAFHNVFKKMLPESNGELLIGEIEQGAVIEYDLTYTFQGEYRLPSNALDPINHSTEHSVEEFDDLHVVMFVQSLVDKAIYQGAIGEREYTEANMDREWDQERIWPVSVAEFNSGKGFAMYPNPTNGLVNIQTARGVSLLTTEVLDIHGRSVYRSSNTNSSDATLDISGLAEGLYIVVVNTTEGTFKQRLLRVGQ
jgi:thiol-disulfide isomerase/thioredoxin